LRVDSPVSTVEMTEAVERAAPLPRPHRRRRTLAAVMLMVAVISGWTPWLLRRFSSHPVVAAIATIDMTSVPDSLRAFPLLLETSLARVSELRIVSDTRLHEVMAQLATRDPSARGDAHRAAEIAGATDVIDGVLSRRARGGLRLDLRRVDVHTGTTRAAFTVESDDPLDLVDLATERI